ncbi:MAG: replication protein [Flavobacteriales bacterium]|nr:replication protein [Flavobacteriales bacterium]
MEHTGLQGTTPVPNGLFDEHLARLKPAELKLLLIIIRQTWGWKDERTGKRKQIDWISGSQLRGKTGCSKRAISQATAQLIKSGFIEVIGERGAQLKTPEERKGKLRLFYRFKNPCGNPVNSQNTKAKPAQTPAHNVPTTKETPTKETDSSIGNQYLFTKNDIQQFEKDLQRSGAIEQLLIDKEAITTKNGERTVLIYKDGTGYRETHLADYSIPGLNTQGLRTPYSLWMTLYHYYQKMMDNTDSRTYQN